MKYKILSAILGVIVLGTAQSTMSADIPTVRVAPGQFTTGIGQLAYTIAQRKGFFAREGVHPELVKVTGSNAPGFEQGYIPAIERGGPADITSIPNGQFVEVVLNGSDGVGVAAETANPVYSLIVSPGIKNFDDLKNKELTLTAPWDNITLSTRELLKKHGLKATDYTFTSVAGTNARMACLKVGKCIATILGQPADIDAVTMGYRRLGISGETGAYVFNVIVVTRAWAEKNKDALVRYLRADADAMRFIHDPKNRVEVAEILGQLTNEPPSVIDEMMVNIENPKLPALNKQGELDMKGFRHVLQLIKEFGLTSKSLPPAEHFVDLSYAKAAGIQ